MTILVHLICKSSATFNRLISASVFTKTTLHHLNLLKPNLLKSHFASLARQDAFWSFQKCTLQNLKRTFNPSCPSRTASSKALSTLASFLLGASGGYLLYRNSDWLLPTAQCKSSYRSRLSHEEEVFDKTPNPKFKWSLFFSLLWEDIFYLLGAILAALGAAVVNIQIPLMLGELTNIVTKFTSDALSGSETFLSEIRKPALKLLTLYGLQGLFTFVYISLLAVVGENLAYRLRKMLFHSLLEQDVEFFDKHKIGKLIDRLTTDVQEFKSSFKMTVSQGLKATVQTLGCVISLYLISPKLTLIMVGVLPIVIIGGTTWGAMLRTLSRDAQEEISKSTAIADEALGNIRTVRSFAMESKENQLYEAQVLKSANTNIRLGYGIGMFQGLANVFLNSLVLGSLFGGGWLISTQELKAGDLISFLVAIQMIERSMAQMSLLLGHVVRGLSAGARVFEFMDSKPLIPLQGGKRIPYHALIGDIQFKDVSFHYPTREQNVLRDFSLKIPGGKLVALVGLSGGGKSTIAVLLERFYDVTAGTITIDGVDVRELDPAWLRGQAIGFINQEPVLFATSVMENIRYGKPTATDQEVIEAAKLANAHDFITGFPKGYNTVLGERGVTVSGGQKQRIAIARALIKNPSILILDEATSALDAESERIVQEALDKVVKGRTTLVIAHRLSTVRDADLIAVVSKGRIMELGTHESLRRSKGLYWELIKKQELEEDIESK
ncbi:mitochondrial potassium channel ATP-binding subunit-like isoform X1 [Biomphalaria glabrata]|uniref:Mitochondrial potassium channel ATP-binding subunit n=1 Tax=Biomphalaria glabrata TaxID=6526 RepID=A0A9U8DXK4_BIOGL|nr:mitochondrial potassium channel ATP-binding subunit-like isoform X1 [Biomphalaria glabrata]XP_013065802.2 mitochondrial potassium channel ATP-binding subunit-like isoform X1 [Biomphalaria glabrata]XP_055900195.1 mitochondrial potassium channel ATP-binding subunit-like isoform X1 [Biomphalaria glabrata]XP_055900196.1 mitochondrial potassium channel ATP-binding subunit-like isoform X1 [Biomphalaria glabrata]XP_055900197.1 mitochondrial potassium channel ATP-binding subunit-like isoform X1 [Bio